MFLRYSNLEHKIFAYINMNKQAPQRAEPESRAYLSGIAARHITFIHTNCDDVKSALDEFLNCDVKYERQSSEFLVTRVVEFINRIKEESQNFAESLASLVGMSGVLRHASECSILSGNNVTDTNIKNSNESDRLYTDKHLQQNAESKNTMTKLSTASQLADNYASEHIIPTLSNALNNLIKKIGSFDVMPHINLQQSILEQLSAIDSRIIKLTTAKHNGPPVIIQNSRVI